MHIQEVLFFVKVMKCKDFMYCNMDLITLLFMKVFEGKFRLNFDSFTPLKALCSKGFGDLCGIAMPVGQIFVLKCHLKRR